MNDVAHDRSLAALSTLPQSSFSAFLLFQIQPLVSKSILPWFGGSPAVWTTCLLFFQSLLFIGYAYAFFIDQQLVPRQQAIVHVALIAASIALLGVLPDEQLGAARASSVRCDKSW